MKELKIKLHNIMYDISIEVSLQVMFGVSGESNGYYSESVDDIFSLLSNAVHAEILK